MSKTKETKKAGDKAKKMKKLSNIKTPDVLKKRCAKKAGVAKMMDASQMINKSPETEAKKMKRLSQVKTPDVLKIEFKKNDGLKVEDKKMKKTEKFSKRGANKKINK